MPYKFNPFTGNLDYYETGSGGGGPTGPTGPTGPAGACGVSGTAGAAGACGVSGVAGACGVSGVSGVIGPTGPSTGAAGGDLTGNYPNPTVVSPLTGKILTDTFEGTAFINDVLSQSVVLPASTSYKVINALEIPAAYTLEIPATSTLVITDFVEQYSLRTTVGVLASLPTLPSSVGQAYYATDDAGGTLYISFDGLTWVTPSKRGLLASATITSSSTGVTATTPQAVTGLSTAATVNSRPVKVTFAGTIDAQSVTAGHHAILEIQRDGSVILNNFITCPLSAATVFLNAGCNVLDNAPAGSHTYSIAIYLFSSGGTILINASAAAPATIEVEEV